MKKTYLVFLILFEFASFGWGRRGHGIVCKTAAYLASETAQDRFLKSHSFDLEYYCNVPDFVWKAPETYKSEWFNHFIDLEIFDRELRGSDLKKAFGMNRSAFDKAYPRIPEKAGRAFWRVRELFEKTLRVKERLSQANINRPERFALQADWLVQAGAIGHYVGDLSMPLHVSENYDGEMTKQKGIHAHFEDEIVNGLIDYGLEEAVRSAARKRWDLEKKALAKQSVLELLEAEAQETARAIPILLSLDRRLGRGVGKEQLMAYKNLAIERLAAGAVFLAEMDRRLKGFDFDDEKFFNFVTNPKHIPVGE